MRPAFAAVCGAILLITSAHRLPAPIVEEEKPTPTPEQSTKPKVKHSKLKEKDEDDSAKAKSTPRPSGKAKNLGGPNAVYPPEAAGLRLSGAGSYLLHFDQTTGRVIDVTVSQSTGSPLLDDAAIAAFRQWHEDPQCAKEVTMTMTFAAPRTVQQ